MLTGDLFQPLTEKKKKPKPTKPDKWAYAKAEAKKKFDVYPSAYANAWAAKKYKELGGGWRMGEDSVEEAEDQKSDASERTINSQLFVDLLRKSQEVPVTGLDMDQRIKLLLAKGLKDAENKIKNQEVKTDQLERELDDIEDEHDQAAAAQGVNVKQAPAAKSEVQKTFNSVAASVNQAIQQTEDPKQRQELQREAERIKGLVRTAKLSNADVQKINKEVKAKGKNGFTAQELQRITDTIAQQAQQTKQEKTAAQQTQAVQQVAQPDPKQLKAVVDTEVKQELQKELEPIKQELNSIKTQRFSQQGQQTELPLQQPEEQPSRAQSAPPAQPTRSQVTPSVQKRPDAANQTPWNVRATAETKLREQDLSDVEYYDFRKPAATWVGIIDDWNAADWNKILNSFKQDYKNESAEDDPYEEQPINLQEAFKLPLLILKQIKRLSNSIDEIDSYMGEIYNSAEYKSMFTQVMFPAFKGKIYNGTVKSKVTNQNFDNDYEFYVHYIRLTAETMNKQVQPFFREAYKFVQESTPEASQDDNALASWIEKNIFTEYQAARAKLKQSIDVAGRLAKFMLQQLPTGAQGQLVERKKKKKSKKRSFGGYYFPGYHYYGQGTAEISDGGGDGGGESMFEVVTKNRTPDETGSLDSYYGRRRQPHKVEDGKRVELTDKEEIQQYLDAYENQTDRKDYGDLDETRIYFRTVATLAESLEQDFGMRQDEQGWYLTPRSGRQRILDAERAFGEPRIL